MTKSSRLKFKYLEKESSFYDKIKAIFGILKRISLKQVKQIFWECKSQTLKTLLFFCTCMIFNNIFQIVIHICMRTILYQHKDIAAIKNVLNKEFENVCKWFLDK